LQLLPGKIGDCLGSEKSWPGCAVLRRFVGQDKVWQSPAGNLEMIRQDLVQESSPTALRAIGPPFTEAVKLFTLGDANIY
jgi:hypothetical protein